MQAFLDQDFLLQNTTARNLYHQYAATMPVVDYHCHINPREIAEDLHYDNITQVWLGGDHYKWRLMRANGVDEKYITGSGSDREKFQAFANMLPKAIGNPMYHWAHLELRRYFDCDLTLGPDTAEEVWNLCNKKLRGGLSVREIIRRSNVTTICTTDDPVDSLEWHQKLREDASFATKVLPAFRPDKAVNVEKPGFAAYIAQLGQAAGVAISGLDSLFTALANRLDFFDSMGCRASDHGLDYVPCRINPQEAEAALQSSLKGEPVGAEKLESYKTALLLFCGKEYAKRGWAMQIHYGAIRSTNAPMLQKLGPDTGFDCISTRDTSLGLAQLLDALVSDGALPQTVLYSLNPGDNAMLGSLIGCFQGPEHIGKIQHGSAWWFNDTKTGMTRQLTNLANMSLLGNFIGMLTDSRSFLSYTRHEYFRRVLCQLIGSWVENGEYPADMPVLGAMIQDISYNNAVRYFGF